MVYNSAWEGGFLLASPPGPLSQDVFGGSASRAKSLLKEGENGSGHGP